MTSSLCVRCFGIRVPVWLPSAAAIQVRGMKSVNTRTPRPMHITRAKLMRVTEYKKPRDPRSPAEQCSMRYKEKNSQIQMNEVQTFMANQCRQVLTAASLVAVFHSDGLTLAETAALRRRLHKADLSLRMYGNKVVQEALAGTQLAGMGPLLVGQNLYAVGDQPAVGALLKATKRLPKIHLMGGLVENRLMSAKQMRDFAQLPPKDVLQGQLAGLLSQSVASTHSLLQRNQQTLVANLSQWIRQREEGSV